MYFRGKGVVNLTRLIYTFTSKDSSNFLRLVFLRLPLAFLFGSFWGGRGAYISHAVSLTITGLVSLYILGRLMGMVDEACAGSADSKKLEHPHKP